MFRRPVKAPLLAACLASMSAASALASENGSTTIGGQVFIDGSQISQQQEQKDGSDKDVSPTGTGFDVKRFYFSVDHEFNEVWAANITTDAQFSSSTTASSGGVSEVFIKKLYLQAKINDAFVAHAGSYNLPWSPFVESLYGYRWVEKTATDRLGFANTTDWGLNATGNIADNLVTYSASVVNGAGFKNPTRTKDVDFEGRVGVSPVPWLTLGAGYYSGHLGQITTANESFDSNTATRHDFAVGVIVAGLRVGAEYFNAKNYKTANTKTGALAGPGGVVVASSDTTTAASDEADGASSWASYAFNEQVSVFSRYDRSKLSKDAVSGLKDTYYNLGVGYKPTQGIDLAVVYKHEKVDDGVISVAGADANSSYTIGGTSPITSGKFSEVGLYVQYLF
jgi:hypothetical protein